MSDADEDDIWLSPRDARQHYQAEAEMADERATRAESSAEFANRSLRIANERADEAEAKVHRLRESIGRAIGHLHVIEAHASSFARFWRNHRAQPLALDGEIQIILDHRRKAHVRLTEEMKIDEAVARLDGKYDGKADAKMRGRKA